MRSIPGWCWVQVIPKNIINKGKSRYGQIANKIVIFPIVKANLKMYESSPLHLVRILVSIDAKTENLRMQNPI